MAKQKAKSIKIHHMRGDDVFNIVIYTVVGLFTFIVFYALYFVVIASISNPNLVASGQVLLIPKDITFEGYKYIFRDRRILIGYRNTIIYTVFGTLLAVFITVPAAYALSRKDFVGHVVLMRLMVFTMTLTVV